MRQKKGELSPVPYVNVNVNMDMCQRDGPHSAPCGMNGPVHISNLFPKELLEQPQHSFFTWRFKTNSDFYYVVFKTRLDVTDL